MPSTPWDVSRRLGWHRNVSAADNQRLKRTRCGAGADRHELRTCSRAPSELGFSTESKSSSNTSLARDEEPKAFATEPRRALGVASGVTAGHPPATRVASVPLQRRRTGGAAEVAVCELRRNHDTNWCSAGKVLRLRRFRYAVYLVVDDRKVVVVAVLHASRDPTDWQRRG